MKTKKPSVKLIGSDGNIFNIMGICSAALKKSGMKKEADEMINRVFNSSSYNEAISIISEYCDVK